jgi:hypothetical protein
MGEPGERASPSNTEIPVNIEHNEGQVVTGSGNTLYQTNFGGLVLQSREAVQAVLRPRPRPRPVLLRPAPHPHVVDRKAEIDTAASALRDSRSVNIVGKRGIGKSTLLKGLAYEPFETAFPDGIIYIWGARPLGDLLQFLYEAFLEHDIPFKATETNIRFALREPRALIIIDDTDLDRDDISTLLNTAPSCTLLLAGMEPRLLGMGRDIPLAPLPPRYVKVLVEDYLGRSLTAGEDEALQTLHDTFHGDLWELFQGAYLAGQLSTSADEVAKLAAEQPRELTAQLDRTLSEGEKNILAVLAIFSGALVAAEHLQAIADLTNMQPVINSLQQRRLIEAQGFAYGLAGTFAQMLIRLWDLRPPLERSLAYFIRWTEERQDTPLQIATEIDPLLRLFERAVDDQRWPVVVRLGKAMEGGLCVTVRWHAWATVLDQSLEAARFVGDEAMTSFFLHQLGTRALCLGDTALASDFLTQAFDLRQRLGDKVAAEVTLHNMQLPTVPSARLHDGPNPTSHQTTKNARRSHDASETVIALLIVFAGCLVLLAAGLWLAVTVGLLSWPFPGVGIPLPDFRTQSPTPTLTPIPTPTQVPTAVPTPLPTPSPTIGIGVSVPPEVNPTSTPVPPG